MAEVNETQQKRWLADNAQQALADVGVSAGQSLLDFGCGHGTCALAAAHLVGKTGTVYALDKDAEALNDVQDNAARQGLTNVKTILSGEQVEVAIQLPASSCDLVLLFDVLHLIDNWLLLLSEVCRILRPDGRLLVFPMHIDRGKVERAAQDAGFASADQVHGILAFSR